MNFKVIQELLGHSKIETTFNLYGHPSWEDIKEETKKIEIFKNHSVKSDNQGVY